MIKKFEFEDTVRQRDEIICHAFSPDLITATHEELEEFLALLWRHFPRTESALNGTRPIANSELVTSFNLASENVQSLIRKLREESRHKASISLQHNILMLSGFSLFVSTGLAVINLVKDKHTTVTCQTQEVSAKATDTLVKPVVPTQKKALPKQ